MAKKVSALPSHLAKLNLAQSESLCRQCGKCCHEKVKIGQLVFYTEQHCRHLDPESKRCGVYPLRHIEQWNCLDLENAITSKILPSDCPYIQGMPDYKAPIENILDQKLAGELALDKESAREELINRMCDANMESLLDYLYEE